MAFPKIGNIAPTFSLLDDQGNDTTLKSFRGQSRVVVYFYPKAMTPGCTIQAQGLRDIGKELKKRKVVVLGISPDPVNRLAKFVERDQLNFRLLSDPAHAVADAYGAWGPKKFMGREFDGILRTTFIVGIDGRLRSVLDQFKTKDHHQVVLDTLDAMSD
jgi:peroxiredoxin Q/BCP